MKGNVAVALPKKLSKRVMKMQKELDLKSPGEVVVRALSLLELSMGRKVELKDNEDTLEINSFKKLRQSIKLEDRGKSEKENKKEKDD